MSAIRRKSGEGSKPYEGRVLYVTAGPSRSLEAVSRALSKSLPLIKRWSSQYDWVDSAEKWDEANAEAVSKAAAEAQREGLKRFVADSTRQSEALTASAAALLAKFDGQIADMDCNPAALSIVARALVSAVELRERLGELAKAGGAGEYSKAQAFADALRDLRGPIFDE